MRFEVNMNLESAVRTYTHGHTQFPHVWLFFLVNASDLSTQPSVVCLYCKPVVIVAHLWRKTFKSMPHELAQLGYHSTYWHTSRVCITWIIPVIFLKAAGELIWQSSWDKVGYFLFHCWLIVFIFYCPGCISSLEENTVNSDSDAIKFIWFHSEHFQSLEFGV